ncbi:MAG: metallophosphoesterase [Chloroflexi bacterium AL-W]|nr:metallophosphoesterase [Chloroflexi bacterium AL-N1]NOK65601.1 metallophosphoesterase [Chloroflexi bacterium AL-N10]NOK74458.1 metallophosphoesterase [Chloroflexi bacterium AL-N5]NOK80634.1 metallophosphoesterase [Chloroflexi bacterium AL-W]NOK88716.1 metallophosphoesterase [Chloroflexi bacterium AL-N15]
MRYTLMHISDLHAGRPFNPDVAVQVAREAHDIRPDLLVISGDFVQRADFVHQWQVITTFLKQLPEPRLMIPGNHDVPLFHFFDRLFRPLRRYKRYISSDINPVFERPGLAVVGGNTAYGWTVDGGYVNPQQCTILEQIFNCYSDDVCKVAVLHHHVLNPPGCEGRHKIRNADEVVRLFDRCNVELLLCGHIHVSYVGTTLDVRPDMQQGTIICQSGTTTSHRGKGREQGQNSYNLIEIADRVIRIEQRLYLEDVKHFIPVSEHVFPRRSAHMYVVPPEERIIKTDI